MATLAQEERAKAERERAETLGKELAAARQEAEALKGANETTARVETAAAEQERTRSGTAAG